MAYWNFRIAVVLSTSIVQFDGENGTLHNQLNILVKKRKVGLTGFKCFIYRNPINHTVATPGTNIKFIVISCVYSTWLAECGPF